MIVDAKLREIDSRRSRTIQPEDGRVVLVNATNSDYKIAEAVGTRVEDLCVEMTWAAASMRIWWGNVVRFLTWPETIPVTA